MNTEQKAIERTETFYQALIENIHEAVLLTDKNLKVIYRNPSAERIPEWTVNEGIEQIHPEDAQIMAQKMNEVLDNPCKPVEVEFRTRNNHGQYITLKGIIINRLDDKIINGIIANLRDITQQRNAEADLQKLVQENRDFKYAMEEASMVAFTDEKGVIKYASHSFSKVSKCTIKELIGKNIILAHSDFYSEEFMKDLWDIVEKGKIWRGELKNVASDGTVYWVDTSIVPFLNREEKPYQYVVIRTDITERKKAEESLQIANERLLFHFENAPLGFIEWDKDWHIKTKSKKAEEIFGWTLKEYIDNNLTGHVQVYEEDLVWVSEKVNKLFSGEMDKNTLIHRNITKDGRVIWCEWFNCALKDKDGVTQSVMSLVQDITNRKKVEDDLLYSETRLKEAQALAQMSNWEIDLRTNVNTWSDEFYSIFGIEKGDVEPSPESFLSLIHPDDVEMATQLISEAFKIYKEGCFTARFKTEKGDIRFFYTEWRFEFDQYNEPIRLYGILQDVTLRKIAEELVANENNVKQKRATELMVINNELLKRNYELDHFVYSTSHDLRAPLKSLLGLTDLIKSDIESTDLLQHERLDMAKRSVLKLDNFIEDILDYSRNTRMEVTNEEINFKEMIQDIRNNHKFMDGTKGLNLKAEIDMDVKYFSDKRRVSVILNNLISNGIKYCDMSKSNSFVKIIVKSIDGNISLIVEDNGIGIAENNRKKIFEMFFRGTKLSTGSGLGLYIVKESLNKLGGTIHIESELWKGTRFLVTLPNMKTVLNRTNENKTCIAG